VRGEQWDQAVASRVVSGLGTVTQLGSLLRERRARTVLILSDPGVRKTGIVDDVAVHVRAAGLTVATHSDIPANPSTASLDIATDVARDCGADYVVAIGGGSALDAAKAVALLAHTALSASTLTGDEQIGAPALPIAAIPTTAGTGAETNGFGVMESSDHRKVYIGSDKTVPELVILDAELTIGLPTGVTAASGFDAVVHGAESLLSAGATTLSRAYAAESLRLTAAALPRAVADGGDVEARSQMMAGAHLAGRALTLSGLGLVHGIGHSLTATLGTPHGVALSSVVGPALRFGVEHAPARYGDLARALDVSSADRAIDRITSLARDVGLPGRPGEIGLTADHVRTVTEKTLADPVTRNSPRVPDHGELQTLLRGALASS
jgi:alcohol dehydrogenase class IV